MQVHNRYYSVNGVKWEARFFHKGDSFPDAMNLQVPRQGVWARPDGRGWENAVFVGTSWQFVNMDLAVQYLPQAD